ncbi:hypothetical protein LXL04_039560 [Taraxacum kok-saghyz]
MVSPTQNLNLAELYCTDAYGDHVFTVFQFTNNQGEAPHKNGHNFFLYGFTKRKSVNGRMENLMDHGLRVDLSSGHCSLLDIRSGNLFNSWQTHDGYVTKEFCERD